MPTIRFTPSPRRTLISVALVGAAVALVAVSSASSGTGGPRVLRVGSWRGHAGGYLSIQSAVDAAKPGDWILVGPGDYHERGDYTTHKPYAGQSGGGVWIEKPGLHLRGMDRNAVVVDGTRPGARPCSAAARDQLLGPADSSGKPVGRNGVEIWKANAVSVDNLTVCNFLAGTTSSGNGVWWNGGDGTGTVGGYGFSGTYLSATSTYYGDEVSAATYGIFSSNWSGGSWDQTYASNFNDSGYYIGACSQICNQTVNHAWAQYNALGYSGSNSGGSLVIENSEFSNNEDGFDTNSQNGDNPPPQNGACPGNGISPITHTHSCWVFIHNYVHDNNNPNVPSKGSAAAAPVGTGMSISGGRNDTIMENRFENNGAWGVLVAPYPDSGSPCTGGTLTPAACLFDESNVALTNNTFKNNGYYGNPTNADFGETRLEAGPSDCFSGNHHTDGSAATSSPPALQTTESTCGGTVPPDLNPLFLAEASCDSQAISIGPVQGSTLCPPGANYPRRTHVEMHPLPHGLATMPNPCAGVPRNPWCPVTVASAASAWAGPIPFSSFPSGVNALEPAWRTGVAGLLVLLAMASAGSQRRFGSRGHDDIIFARVRS